MEVPAQGDGATVPGSTLSDQFPADPPTRTTPRFTATFTFTFTFRSTPLDVPDVGDASAGWAATGWSG